MRRRATPTIQLLLRSRRRLLSPSLSYNTVFSRRRTFSGDTTTKNNDGSSVLHHEWIVNGKVVRGGGDAGGTPPPPTTSSSNNNNTVLFLHGLLGSGKNLRSPAKRLTQQHPHLSALVLDLRGHGKTSSSSNNNSNDDDDDDTLQHTLSACTDDIIHTVQQLDLIGPDKSPIGVVGHSFGGRLALEYVHSLLKDHPDDYYYDSDRQHVVHPPKRTFLLDTVPGHAHSSVAQVVDVLSKVPMPFCGRKQELVQFLVKQHNVDPTIAMWMTTNLVSSPDNGSSGCYIWAFDLNVIRQVLEDFPNQDFTGLVRNVGAKYVNHANILATTTTTSAEQQQRRSKLSLVMAGKNEGWTTSVVDELEQMRETSLPSDDAFLDLHVLPEAGHWVHVDDLDGLMGVMEGGFD